MRKPIEKYLIRVVMDQMDVWSKCLKNLENCFRNLPDLDAKLWRFIDIPKFVSLLDKEALYFSNSNTFDDPYEGRIGNYNKNFDIRLKKFRGRLEGVKDDNLKRLILATESAFENLQNTTSYELLAFKLFSISAMWDLYSNRNSGIAIQSTFRRLCNSFDKTNFTIHIGEVNI